MHKLKSLKVQIDFRHAILTESPEEVTSILRKVAEEIDEVGIHSATEGTIRDINGAKVGFVRVEAENET